MGISDREYYRDESGGFRLFAGIAPATKAIILINVVLFLLFWSPQESALRDSLAANSNDVLFHGKIWQLLTAPFLHSSAGLGHIFWNMLFLWFVGREVEGLYGSREFTLLYLAGAILSTLAWVLIDRLFPEPGLREMVGASGAVMTILVVYAMHYPRREVLLFFVVPVETWMLVVVYLGYDAIMLLQALQGIGVGPAMNTAFTAHLAGGAVGFGYKHYGINLSRLFGFGGRRPRLRLVNPPRDRERPSVLPMPTSRSASMAGAAKPSGSASFPEEQLDQRLDEVLAKIAREGGRSGLTDEERQVLEAASKRARDRRSERP